MNSISISPGIVQRYGKDLYDTRPGKVTFLIKPMKYWLAPPVPCLRYRRGAEADKSDQPAFLHLCDHGCAKGGVLTWYGGWSLSREFSALAAAALNFEDGSKLEF